MKEVTRANVVTAEGDDWITPPEFYEPLAAAFATLQDAFRKAAPNIDKNSYTLLVKTKEALNTLGELLVDLGNNVDEVADAEASLASANIEVKDGKVKESDVDRACQLLSPRKSR